jgi:hypothetical protein
LNQFNKLAKIVRDMTMNELDSLKKINWDFEDHRKPKKSNKKGLKKK